MGYYGELVPNTYTLKVEGIPLSSRLENGISFVTKFLKEIYVLLILVGAALLFDFRRSTLLVAGVFAAALGYQVWTGGDAWQYWRLLSPAVPLLLAVGVRVILVAV